MLVGSSTLSLTDSLAPEAARNKRDAWLSPLGPPQVSDVSSVVRHVIAPGGCVKVMPRTVFRKREMAHRKGFEPLASAFGGQRSIQLSYRCLETGR